MRGNGGACGGGAAGDGPTGALAHPATISPRATHALIARTSIRVHIMRIAAIRTLARRNESTLLAG